MVICTATTEAECALMSRTLSAKWCRSTQEPEEEAEDDWICSSQLGWPIDRVYERQASASETLFVAWIQRKLRAGRLPVQSLALHKGRAERSKRGVARRLSIRPPAVAVQALHHVDLKNEQTAQLHQLP